MTNRIVKDLFMSWCLDWWHDMFILFSVGFFSSFSHLPFEGCFQWSLDWLEWYTQWTQLCLDWWKCCLLYKLGSRFPKTCRTRFVSQSTSRRRPQSATGKYHLVSTIKSNLRSSITSSKQLTLLQTLPQPSPQVVHLSLHRDWWLNVSMIEYSSYLRAQNGIAAIWQNCSNGQIE